MHQKCTRSAPTVHHNFIKFPPHLYIQNNINYKTAPNFHQNCTTTAPQLHQQCTTTSSHVHHSVLWHCLTDCQHLPLNSHGGSIHTSSPSTFKRSLGLLESLCTHTKVIHIQVSLLPYLLCWLSWLHQHCTTMCLTHIHFDTTAYMWIVTCARQLN